MLYRIITEQRMDKQKPVIDAIKELTSDFIILQGRAWFGNTHKPVQIIEINVSDPLDYIDECLDKLKKILNTPTILVTKIETTLGTY